MTRFLILRRGSTLIPLLTTIVMLSALGVAALSISLSQKKLQDRDIRKQQIFEIAEAGINYYRWFLAHYPNDYQDGSGTAGPYTHDYSNADGVVIGQYQLTITPPITGSTIATIQSTGCLINYPNVKKTLVARVGIPSWSRYAVVANDDLRFGEGTETFGPIHSNGGIRFDGLAHGLVTSAQTKYDDPDHSGGKEFGVHTHLTPVDPLPPAAVPARTDVFAGGRQFPVSPVDFNSISVDLADMETKAISNGIWLDISGGQGYHLTLRADDKVDIKKVNTELTCQYKSGSQWRDFGYCSNDFNDICNTDSGCSSATCIMASHGIGNRAGDESSFTYGGSSSIGLPLPTNGIIFVKDNVWVDGVVDGARVTIVAAKDPIATGTADVYLNNDIRYTHPDGRDAIGIIAQNNVLVGLFSKNGLQIDAALLAQHGHVGRAYYGGNFTTSTSSSDFRIRPSGSSLPNGGGGETSCEDFRKRSSITTYGALGTYQRYGFAWTGSLYNCGGGQYNGSGYCTRNLNFDTNLTFAPPPNFPTTGEYQLISYDEIE